MSFFHYVSGAITIAFSSMFIIHLTFMTYFLSNPEFIKPEDVDHAVNTAEVMRVFVYVFWIFIILGITYGILEIMSGVFIKRRKHRLFSLIVAIPRILFIPYGSILSIFTLILLDRDSVKTLYERQQGENEERLQF